MTTKNDSAGEETFEALLSRLEGLVTKLERGDLPLEESLQAYEVGVGLVKRAKERLDNMDRRLEELQHDGRLAPMDPASMKATAADKRPAPAPRAAQQREHDDSLVDDDLPF